MGSYLEGTHIQGTYLTLSYLRTVILRGSGDGGAKFRDGLGSPSWKWATQNANLAITGKLPTLSASAFSSLRSDNTVFIKMVLDFVEEM